MPLPSFLVRVEVLLESLPAFVILLVHLLAGLLPPFGERKTEGALKHEGLRKVRKMTSQFYGWRGKVFFA